MAWRDKFYENFKNPENFHKFFNLKKIFFLKKSSEFHSLGNSPQGIKAKNRDLTLIKVTTITQ